jgi:2-amino-4-hydroxy-6-hydroxymethyldihydropteridine diphosphokinase
MYKVFLGIGGNLGNKPDNFKKVHQLIQNEMGEIVEKSSVYESPPWGFEAKESFWNQVLVIHSDDLPHKLLNKIHEIEKVFGRKRNKKKYSSREMDIDILYFDNAFIEEKNLIVPHPLINKRKFVLVPLAEIAPNLKHPLLRLTSLEMLDNCRDKSILKKVNPE